MRFGGLVVLEDISFRVNEGEIFSIIGPNGAGKTTLFNILSGIYTPSEGTMWINGEMLNGLKMHSIAIRGVGRTFQNVRLFGNMSVIENVMVGQHCRTRSGFWKVLFRTRHMQREEREIVGIAMTQLEFVGLSSRAWLPATSLPFGKQRLLEIARTLASRPRLLFLDEPAAGLNPRETVALSQFIERIREQGITILLVEHDMDLVMGISDRIMVLNHGRKICEGNPREVQGNPEVIAAYLGG
jgi:branched-chain amino acid transport system ATP-binding protein